jgi:hypothetical protein
LKKEKSEEELEQSKSTRSLKNWVCLPLHSPEYHKKLISRGTTL